MAHFEQKTGNRSALRYLKNPFPDVMAFDTVIRSLVLKNPLGCTSYMKAGKNHPPIEKVREQYTAKFAYEDAKGKQVGNGLDMYTSVEGYQYRHRCCHIQYGKCCRSWREGPPYPRFRPLFSAPEMP